MFNRKIKETLYGWEPDAVERLYGVKPIPGLVKRVKDLEDEVEKLKAIVAEVTNYVYSEKGKKK